MAQKTKPAAQSKDLTLGGLSKEDIYAQRALRDGNTIFTWYRDGRITCQNIGQDDEITVRTDPFYNSARFFRIIQEEAKELDAERQVAWDRFRQQREEKRNASKTN